MGESSEETAPWLASKLGSGDFWDRCRVCAHFWSVCCHCSELSLYGVSILKHYLWQSTEMGRQQRRLHRLAPGSSQHLKAVCHVQFIIS